MTVFKEMTLGKQIASGIALMLLLMLVVGGAGYYGLNRVNSVMGIYRQVNALQSLAAAFRDESSKYMLSEMQDDAAGSQAAYGSTFSLIEKADAMLTRLESMPGITREEAREIVSAREAMEAYKEHFEEYLSANMAKTDLASQTNSQFEELFKEVDGAEFWKEDMVFSVRIMSNYALSYFNRTSEVNWEKLKQSIDAFAVDRDEWAGKTSSSEILSARAEKSNRFWRGMWDQ